MQWASAGAGQIGVEQRDHAADAGDAEPDRHDIPAGSASAGRRCRPCAMPCAQRPARIAVGARGELAIAEAARGRRAAPARRRSVSASSSMTCGNTRVGFLAIGVVILQGAQRAPQTGDVGREPVDESHGDSVSRRLKHSSMRLTAQHSAKHRAVGRRWQASETLPIDAAERHQRVVEQCGAVGLVGRGGAEEGVEQVAGSRRGSRSRVISTMRVRWSSSGQRGSRTGG